MPPYASTPKSNPPNRADPYHRRTRHAPRRLIDTLLCLGWTGLGLGALMMIWGLQIGSVHANWNLFRGGIPFSLAALILLAVGYGLNRSPSQPSKTRPRRRESGDTTADRNPGRRPRIEIHP